MTVMLVCESCGKTPRIIPCYGGFGVVCGCPPVDTVTSAGTQVEVSRFEPTSRGPRNGH